MFLVLIVSLYTTRVVLNVLGFVDYGIYNVVAGFVSLFSFINVSMSNSIQRYYNFEKGLGNASSLNVVYNTAIQIQFAIAIIILLLLETFGIWYINNIMVIPEERVQATNWVFQCSALSLVFVIMQVPFSALIMAQEKLDYYAIVSIIDVFLKLLVVLGLPYIPYDKLFIYGMLSLAISIINFLCYLIYCKHCFTGLNFERQFHKEHFKSIFSFSGWTMLDILSNMLKGQGLNVLMNSFFGPVVNAARGIAFQIMNALSGFSSNIVTAFRPQLVESYAQKEIERTRALMFIMSKSSFVLLAMLATPIMLNLNYVLTIWLGDDIPAYTVSFTILVLVDLVLSSLNTPLTQTVLATGKIRRYQIIRSIVIAFVLPISWILLKSGAEPTSVFWVCIFITVINQVVSIMLLHQVFDFEYNDYWREVLLPCLLFLIITPLIPLVASIMLNDGLLQLIISGVVSVFMSIVVAYYLVLSVSERQSIIKLIKRKK